MTLLVIVAYGLLVYNYADGGLSVSRRTMLVLTFGFVLELYMVNISESFGESFVYMILGFAIICVVDIISRPIETI
jgi:hypothetical protein